MAIIGVITSRFPYPLDKGDKLRIFNQIKSLSENHQVKLICITNKMPPKADLEAVKCICDQLEIIHLSLFQKGLNTINAFFGTLPLQVGLFFDKNKLPLVHAFFKDCDVIYAHLIRVSEYVKDLPQRKTLDYMDAFSKGVERWHASAHFLLKPILKLEHKRLLVYERTIFNRFERKTIITDQDKYLIPHENNAEIDVVPNGVDFSKYKPVDLQKKYDILFCGNMGYVPNIDAALFAATKIMPLIWEQNSTVNLLIAGTGAPDRIKKLASSHIFVIEQYEDINLAYSESRINIAPMFLSIGLQNKILQGMANRMPNISTSLANNAVQAEAQKDIIEANNENEFAEAILKLLNDPQYFDAIANNGFSFVKNNYSWQKHNSTLEKILIGN